jgi:DMSO/TMAO reductase YedYZ heme-binding membrane subunit
MADDDKLAVDETIVMTNKSWEWVTSFVICLALFVFMLEYHRWRAKPYSLFTVNKALAIASVVSIAFALSLGPIYRLIAKFPSVLRMRRPLGITGVAMAVLHVLLTLCFIPKFNFNYYKAHSGEVIVGMVAFVGFLVLMTTSFRWAIKGLGRMKWKIIQKFGYAFLALVLLHAIILTGKIYNWPKWFSQMKEPVPPGSFAIFVLCLPAFLLKGVDMLVQRNHRSGKKIVKYIGLALSLIKSLTPKCLHIQEILA